MANQDPMLDIFIFECQQLLETLEDTLLTAEKEHRMDDEQINEIFRIMHTIKGSASMMSFDNLSSVAHAVEDLFSQIREKKARSGDWDGIFEIVLEAADLLKEDIGLISVGQPPQSEGKALIDRIHNYLELISHRVIKADEPDDAALPQAADEDEDIFDVSALEFYKIKVTFSPDCQMENMRAFGVVNSLEGCCRKKAHIPEDLMSEEATGEIAKNGFTLYIQSGENPDAIKQIVDTAMYLKTSSIIQLPEDSDDLPESIRPKKAAEEAGTPKDSAVARTPEVSAKQNFISVNVNKLDKLMDLIGEIVTTESMVTKNPEISSLQIEGFESNAKQLEKLITEMQETIMSVRMVPVSTTFHKMNRIVRDMSKKIHKEVELVIIGEETEVDKNINDSLSDPLMHLIRNAVDHGLEMPDERVKAGKPAAGRVTLEARNTGGDVMIIVSDDGAGMDRGKIVKKAIEHGLTSKSDAEISDKEAYSFVFMPGFSTNDQVTEYSGRGVGMDVVRRNIEKVGGTISLESTPGQGTSFFIRIPLTLAIIEGMKFSVGDLVFIVPMLSIQESFKPDMEQVFLDPDGNEMIMIRGECYPILRLHSLFDIEAKFTNLEDGILIMLNAENRTFCLFVDDLIGEQQAVIKPLPTYIQTHNNGMHGIGGCAILGDGSISLIIDINNLVLS